MANTVNDVMNVIASPDYGIKNIAGTNQEILAILSGTHNSKNNLHAIVDDVRNLLQKLVDTSIKKKNIEVGDKSTKINPKHIQNILDESKNIKKAIDNLSKAIEGQSKKSNNMPAVAKLTNKASQKVADAMIKSMEKQNKGGGIATLIDAFTKLKDISLKDLILGNRKLKRISKLFKNAKQDLNIKEKDLNSIIKLINAAPEMVKSLQRVNWRIDRIIKNKTIKKISDIFVGKKDSLLAISKALQKNVKIFSIGNESVKNIKDLFTSLKKTMKKIVSTTLWIKLANIGVTRLDIMLDNIIDLSNKLKKNKKNINAGSKAAKNIEGLASSLKKAIDKLVFAALWSKLANIGAKSLDIMVNNTIKLSKKLNKNRKDIKSGSKAVKNIEGLASSLKKTMKKIVFASLWSNLAIIGVKSLDTMLNNIIKLSKKLNKNRKDIKSGSKAAKSIRRLSGNLMLTSIFLTASLVTVLPAILGALALSVLVDVLIPIGKKLSRNRKKMSNAAGAAIMFTAFTGLMLVSSLFLTKIAEQGLMPILGALALRVLVDVLIPSVKKLSRNGKKLVKATGAAIIFTAFTGLMLVSSLLLAKIAEQGLKSILGSVIIFGVVAISVFTFKILNKAKKNILMGSIAMALMSLSLLLFGVALGKITKATEKVSWKQVGIIATTLVLLALATAAAGIPAVAPFILLGAVSIGVMSLALMIFGVSLGKISKATEKLKFLQVVIVAGSILALGVATAVVGVLSPLVILGSIAMIVLSLALMPFVKTLGEIAKTTEKMKFKQIALVAGAIGLLGVTVGIVGVLSPLILLGSLAVGGLTLALKPFVEMLGETSKATEKLTMRNIGLVAGAMGALGAAVAGMSLLAIPIAAGSLALEKMGSTLFTFVKTLKLISDMGDIPKAEIADVIEVMKSLSIHFSKNSLKLKAITSAKRHLKLMTHFAGAVEQLDKLNKFDGEIPMELVSQSLLAMTNIANYYKDNPIKNKIVKQAKKHQELMGYFGKSVEQLDILNKFDGKVPVTLVFQVLNVLRNIGNYYKENPIEKKVIKQAKNYNKILIPFARTIKRLNKLKKMGSIPMELVYQTLNIMKTISDYYKENPIENKVIKQAKNYKKMLRPFGSTIEKLVKLKEMGGIPMSLIFQVLNTMNTIAIYYKENPIEKKVIDQAKNYKKMLRPFASTIEKLVKLKEIGNIPMELVYQTLNIMKTIGNYYKENPIEKKVIKQAKNYKKMLRPFASTIKKLAKLKEMGGIPMALVFQALNTMRIIGDYYKENSIEKKAIKQAENYNKMLKPFGTTIGYLSELKNMGSIPTKLVYQALSAISKIANFYHSQEMGGRKKEREMKQSATMIANVVSSFGMAVKSLKTLNDLRQIPIESVQGMVGAIKDIAWFYMHTQVDSANIEEKCKYFEIAVDKFTTMAKNIRDKFKGMQEIDSNAVRSIVNICRSIINFYTLTQFASKEDKKIVRINGAIEKFADTANYLKDILKNFSTQDLINSTFAVGSMQNILSFLKNDSLNNRQIKKAQNNISLLSSMATAMSNVAKIDPTNIASVGESLTTALNGVHSVDISQVNAVTNMFSAFSGINKSENIVNKFAETVKEFTSTCKDLMDAMEQNTNAINNMEAINGNMDGSLQNNTGYANGMMYNNGNNTGTPNDGIRITNVDELAKTIAEKINGVLSVDVPDTQVQLLINGSGGNEWIISRY